MRRREFITFLGGAVTWSVRRVRNKLKGCAASVFATATLLLVLTGFGHSISPNASPARCAFEGLFIAGIVPCPDPGRRT
jgi:hypothetical protein